MGKKNKTNGYQEQFYLFNALRQKEQEFNVQRRWLFKTCLHFNACKIFSCSLFLSLGTLCFQTSANGICVKLHFHRLPSSSGSFHPQQKVNEATSDMMNEVSEISTDTTVQISNF